MAPPPNPGDANNEIEDDPLGGMDPMAWLESLAARQGANPDELTTAHDLDIPELPPDTVIDEPGYTPGYETSKPAAAEPAPTPPQPEPAAAAAPAMSSEELMAMDPMAWLESLAARQGAKAEELTTAHDMDVPELPPDTVIDEPGYTPGYETSKPAAEPTRAERRAAKSVEPVAEPAPQEAPPAPQPEPVSAVEP